MTLAAVILVLVAGMAMMGQDRTGTVCIAARIDSPFFKEPATLPNGEVNSHGLKVRIDKRQIEEWPTRKSLKIEDLDLTQSHIFAVLDATGHPIESVRFKFSSFQSTKLCALYDGYQGIGLQEMSRHTPWCKCR